MAKPVDIDPFIQLDRPLPFHKGSGLGWTARILFFAQFVLAACGGTSGRNGQIDDGILAEDDAGADASLVDVSRETATDPDDPTDASGAGDGKRIREGAVQRDGRLSDNDASGVMDGSSGDAETGPRVVCGDGKKEGNEQCDDGNLLDTDGCSSTCTDTAACDACLGTRCADPDQWPSDNPVWPFCGRAQGNAREGEGAGRPRSELCHEVYACAKRTNCIVWDRSDLSPCYCGTASGAVCLTAGKPNGPCIREIENGMESTDPTFINGQFTSAATAAGDALALLLCAAELCSDECFAHSNGEGGPDPNP